MQRLKISLPRWIKWAVAVIVLLTIVAVWNGSRNASRRGDAGNAIVDDSTIPPVRIKDNGSNVMRIEFPQTARSGNIDVDRFISRFLDILLGQDYKQYRLQVTQQREPISIDTFEQAYRNVEVIAVDSIKAVEDLSAVTLDGLKGIERPVYRVQAHVILRDGTRREVELYVFREANRWVSSH